MTALTTERYNYVLQHPGFDAFYRRAWPRVLADTEARGGDALAAEHHVVQLFHEQLVSEAAAKAATQAPPAPAKTTGRGMWGEFLGKFVADAIAHYHEKVLRPWLAKSLDLREKKLLATIDIKIADVIQRSRKSIEAMAGKLQAVEAELMQVKSATPYAGVWQAAAQYALGARDLRRQHVAREPGEPRRQARHRSGGMDARRETWPRCEGGAP